MKLLDPRQLAYEVLRRVDEGAYSDLALDAALRAAAGIDPRDRALATELVYGVLRRRGSLDFALAGFCSQHLGKVEECVLTLLRLGTYQILFLDRVPAPAAVHETVELARTLGLERATGFINGILRALIRGQAKIPWPDPQQATLAHLEHVLSLPGWLARRWRNELGSDEALALAAAMLEPAPFTVRVNALRLERDAYLQQLLAAGYEAQPTRYAPEGVTVTARLPGSLPGSGEGSFQVQDEASMLVARLLDPQPGERILDACSAPGGKTTHIAALAGNEATILALDLHAKRLRMVSEGIARLGCAGIEVRPCDLSRPPEFLEAESFDRVLVDAPCSGLGVLRRNPETRWRRAEADIVRLAALQRSILGNVAPLVRPGGILFYSLCTATPEETDGVVGAFLESHPEFVSEDLRLTAPEGWQDLFDEEGALRTLPHRHGGMDAFFAVRFRRRA